MKKIILFFNLVFITTFLYSQNTAPTPGKVRVYFAGFDCVQPTWDDALQLDGKGDEVLLNINMTIADASGNTRMNKAYRSPTYGDATGAFSNRVNTGSCLSLLGDAKGGLKNGDKYRCNNLIDEFDMGKNDVLSVLPIIFEWDQGGPETVNDVSNVTNNAINSLNKQVISIVNKTGNIITNQDYLTATSISPSSFVVGNEMGLRFGYDGIFETLIGKNVTKPIGLNYSDRVLPNFNPLNAILPTPLLQKLTSIDYGAGKGIIPIRYDEPALRNTRDNGIYIVWIKLEFIPAVAPAPASGQFSVTSPKVVSATSSGTFRTTTMSTLATPTLSTVIVGTWEGTRGAGTNETPDFYSLKFNNDNTVWLLSQNQNGQIVSKGAYLVSGDKFDGTYTLSNGTLVKITGSLANNKLNGTWTESTNNKSANGKWVMNKK